MKHSMLAFLVVCFLTGCVSMAKLSNFSQTSSSIDFDKLSKEYKSTKTPFWTLQTSNEFYIEKVNSIAESMLLETIQYALTKNNFVVSKIDQEHQCVFGKRGLRANEWGSITAVYYKMQNGLVQVYVKTEITQDVSGGWRENRSMKVGEIIAKRLSVN